ncbi:hypothetical protein [Octadecabacter temperatus]|uniref:hypothetical protein n=1 Tax=Octadecabacter temperatus TaxID=1458307 RepID=UPI000676A1AB|nr:hypothetical protein [Octadecabacter temperatus]
MSNRYLTNLAPDDVAGFYDGFRRLLSDVCGAKIESAPEAADALIAQVATITDEPIGLEARLALTLLADLKSNGELGRLWFGRGTITGRVQPYSLIVEDLSRIDVTCPSVGFVRFRKGNPWFALQSADIAKDICTVQVLERRMRRKQVELVQAQSTGRPLLRAFLYQVLAEFDGGQSVIIMDSPPSIEPIRETFTQILGTPLDLENTMFFERENTFVRVSWVGFWTVTLWIPNANAPHLISDDVCKALSFHPDSLKPVK